MPVPTRARQSQGRSGGWARDGDGEQVMMPEQIYNEPVATLSSHTFSMYITSLRFSKEMDRK